MKKNHSIQLAVTLLAVAAVSACSETNNQTAPAPAPADVAPPTGLEVNAPIKQSDIDIAFSVVGTPAYDVANDTLSYTVKVANNGKAAIASAGSRPVNIGVVILGTDGTLKTAPAKQDFIRIPLPQALEPGENLDVPVTFKVAPTLGGTVIIDAVQERVAWFRGYDKPVLTLGSFVRCNGEEKSVCLSDGTAIAAAR